MKIVAEIKQPILKEMELFEEKFKESMISNVPLLNRITHYIVRRKGKQMRPMFVFLVAKMVSDGKFSAQTYRGASVIELIHTATLVHDDVVDDSNRRRGFFSLNALWKNKIAVLVGDFLLSKGLLLSIDNGDFDILRLISVAVREMSEGELLQIEKARKLDITEAIYFDIIRQKTAKLIAACCGIGAASVGSNAEEIEKMRKFGELIGIAFQIKDDLFDYSDAKIGKPTGLDIRERKMTLPLIYVLNNSTPEIKKELINIVKNHNENPKKVKKAIQIVIDNGGIDYSYKKMIEYKEKAMSLIDSIPDSDAKKSLIGLIEYTTTRTK
ncbi:MAG: polyprenyl synthetase family protein [Flavobacteriaceae bacterium]|nr:polyprenyl synthetase family protein [Flavobacteriaceae bacterium]